MPAVEPHPSHTPFLQLPVEVLQQVIKQLLPDDQRSLTQTCKQARSIAASAVTQLSISQHTMAPLPPHLAQLPAAFTATHHLTLDLTGNLLTHTLPFLQSFQQHCSATLNALTSLTLQLNVRPSPVVEQLAQLLGSCRSLSLLKLEFPEYDINMTLREQATGAGLHHLSHCFHQCSQPLHRHLLLSDTCRQHMTAFGSDGVQDIDVGHSIWPHLPALQELSFLASTQALSLLPALTCLTHLHLRISNREVDELQLPLQQTIAALAPLRALNLDAPLDALPAAWSSLRQLTKLTLRQCILTQDSGLWHLTHLETLCVSGCKLSPSVRFTSLVGLRHLQVLGSNGGDLSPDHLNFFPSSLTFLHLTTKPHDDYGFDKDGHRWLTRMATLAGTLRTLILECESLLPRSSIALITQLTFLQQLELSFCSSGFGINPGHLACMTHLTSPSMEDTFRMASKADTQDMLAEHQCDLRGMTCLQQLNLKGHMSLASITAVPSSLTCLVSPLVVGVDGDVMPVPESLRHCQSLSMLSLGCSLSHWRFERISDPTCALGCLTSLQSLRLQEVVPSALASMCPMPLLTSLHLAIPLLHSTVPPPWLQYSTRLKSLELKYFKAPPNTLPATLTHLDIAVAPGKPVALPRHWGCMGVRSLSVAAFSGVSDVSSLTALTALSSLQVEHVVDPNVDPLDSLLLLTHLIVRPKTGCRVTYRLPQLQALKEEGVLQWDLSGCICD